MALLGIELKWQQSEMFMSYSVLFSKQLCCCTKNEQFYAFKNILQPNTIYNMVQL